MNRRTILTGTAALSIGALAPIRRSIFAAPATPVTAGGVVVASYADVRDRYLADREALLNQGREIIATLFGNDAGSLYNRLQPQVQELFTPELLASIKPALETNRVHFEIAELGAIFDGHLDGPTISGVFVQGPTSTFMLSAGDGSPTSVSRLDGRWTGHIDTGQQQIGIEVTFQSNGDDLSGTIDVPEQQITAVQLTNVRFDETVPIGDLISEQALPVSPDNRGYVAQYDWNDAAVTAKVGIAPDGTITLLSVAPEWPLPPDPAAGYVSPVSYHLPFAGLWFVLWGGATVAQNYHAATASQRHAMDLVIWNDGASHSGDGTQNQDYWCYGQTVIAPATGTVVSVLDSLPDNTLPATNTEVHPAGNHVVIQTAEGEFVYVAHLQPGAIQVTQGETVAVDAPIGLTGNSGNSFEPHLHIHAQDRAEFVPEAIGLPLNFSDYLANGEPVALGMPVQGQFIQRM